MYVAGHDEDVIMVSSNDPNTKATPNGMGHYCFHSDMMYWL